MSSINLDGINPSLVRFTQWLADNAATDTKIETIYQLLNQYTQEIGPDQPGTFMAQDDAHYEEFLTSTGQREEFRQWQLMRRKAKEVEREGEELAENVFGLSMAQQQSREEGYNFGDFIPKIGEGYYDEEPLAGFEGEDEVQIESAHETLAEAGSSGASPSARKSNYHCASRFHLSALFARNIIQNGDELRVPISAVRHADGSVSPVANVSASMVYQDRKQTVASYIVYCPALGVHGALISGKGPAQLRDQLALMNLIGPKTSGWSNVVEIYRGQYYLGTITQLKQDFLM